MSADGTKTRATTSYIGALLILLVMAIFFFTNFKTVVVSGQSMEPTFLNGRRLLASSAYWLVGSIRKNDVVVVRNEVSHEYVIKRVYRVAGEKVDWVNAPDTWDISAGEFVVPPDNIFVLGDNRAVSEDSRRYGPVPLERVIGKVVVR